MQKNQSLFQFRRIYLGCSYQISPRFSSELLLAAENDFAGGDLLANNNFSPFIKRANLQWKAWKGTDIIFGQVSTPDHTFSSDEVWGYRSVEKTLTDIRHTPGYDLGIEVRGHFSSSNDNYGYNIMVGNGQAAKPENDRFKWFYGDVFAKFFDKKLRIDLYSDYNRLNWTPGWHHARNMYKIITGYTLPKFTFGMEAFINNISADVFAARSNGNKDTITSKSRAISIYARGALVKNKIGFFARYDIFDPSINNNNSIYVSYAPQTTFYDVNTRENFFTAGLDFTPDKNIHIMPNVWYNGYKNSGPKSYGSANNDYDLVFRITIFWILTQ